MANNVTTTNPMSSLGAAPDWDFSSIGRITASQFKFFFGVAAVCFVGRMFIRLFTRKRLYLDDAFLILSFACLCGATVIMILRNNIEYLVFAVLRQDPKAYIVAMENMDELLSQTKWHIAYLTLLWTAVFSVKWCYFAFFFNLLCNMSRWLIYYYWFAVALSVGSWIFIEIGENLIACPYVGEAAVKCFPTLPASHTLLLATFWAYPCLDAVTDLMIISIPITLLGLVRMRTITIIGMGIFLCLSAFMFTCAIVRGAGTWYDGALDYPWGDFWLHAEACISVIMGSLTVYRSTLIGSNEVSDLFRAYVQKLKGYIGRNPPSTHDSNARTSVNHLSLPKIQRSRSSRFRTFLGRNTHSELISVGSSRSSVALREEETDYHAFLRASKPATKRIVTQAAASEQNEAASNFMNLVLGMLGYQVLLHHREIGSGKVKQRQD